MPNLGIPDFIDSPKNALLTLRSVWGGYEGHEKRREGELKKN